MDVSRLFSVATSVDLQHLDLSPSHISKLPELAEMPALTHASSSGTSFRKLDR